MNPSISKLQFYSIGIVAANKKLSSDRIEVVPMEGSPLMSGELTDNIEQYQGGSQSPEGENFKVDMQTTASIEARWLPMNDTNRITSPDVRRGEMVAIYQFSDADEYWWMTLKQDKKLRRLETVIFSFSNVRKENEEVTAKNSYWMEVSTHGKYIHIHTSKNDEEPFEYDIQLNSKDGCLTFKDDDGNYIFMNSKERQIKLRNKDDSFVDIDKKKIHINAVDEVLVTTKKFEVRASNTIKMTTKDYSLSTTKFGTDASSWLTKVPTAEFSTNVEIGSSLDVGSNIKAGGRISAPTIYSSDFKGDGHT